MGLVKCRTCLLDKPLEDFNIALENRSGRNTQCRECQRAYNRAHYRANKRRRSKQTRDYYHKDPGKWQSYAKDYRAKNLEKTKERQRQCRRKNPPVYRANSARYRASKKEAFDPGADPVVIQKLYQLCDALNKRSKRKGGWSVDHTIPLSVGGKHHEGNLQVVPCAWNYSKNNKHSNRWEGKYPPWVHKYCVDIGLSF